METNTVFVYYLEKVLNLSGITVDHIYTCYKAAEQTIPGALAQSLLDTASRKGWLDTSNMSDISLPTGGENLVERVLPRAAKVK